MRSCSFARAISSTGRRGAYAGCSCGGACGTAEVDSRRVSPVAFGRGGNGVPVRGSVTLHLPDVLQPPQQHLLAGLIVGEVDLLQVERELQLGEFAANLVLVIELGFGSLLDRARQPQQSPDRAEYRRGERMSEEAHAHPSQLTAMLTKLYGGTGPKYLNMSRSLNSSLSLRTASSNWSPFCRSTRKAAFTTMRSLTILFVSCERAVECERESSPHRACASAPRRARPPRQGGCAHNTFPSANVR